MGVFGVRTVGEHDDLIESLIKRDHALTLATMEAHRASTASGLSPEAFLQQTHALQKADSGLLRSIVAA